jgi:hypothetical protein
MMTDDLARQRTYPWPEPAGPAAAADRDGPRFLQDNAAGLLDADGPLQARAISTWLLLRPAAVR